jgi:hydroxylamine dehydrogenase
MSRVMMEGGKGCGGCHKFGLKDEKEWNALKAAGTASQGGSCDVCHTRHNFSKTEAQQPQACQTCHQGDDHPQWLMYSGSKHGVRSAMKQIGALPKNAGAPTCQTCHMPKGDHAVKTAWGFFGLRLPLPEDPEWATDRVTIFQAMGLFGMDGKPTPMIEGAKKLDLFRFTDEEFRKERNKMITTCTECHTKSYAETELAKGDALLREADKIMAQGIREVASLYRDGIVKKPEGYPAPFPVILTFHEAPNPAEGKLFQMFLDHRPLVYMGAYHNNPEYPIWYGYSEMLADLYEIRKEAAELRKEKHAR